MERIALFPGSFDPFTVGHGKFFEDFMDRFSNVMAYRKHRIVHVGYTRTVTQGIPLQKKYKFEKYVALYFRKAKKKQKGRSLRA